MLLYHCLKCRENTESKNPEVVRTKNIRIILLSKFVVIVKNQNLLKNKKLKDYQVIRAKLPILSDIPLVNTLYKMNKIVNKFLLAGDTIMPKMHLRQPGFTYKACGPFTKNKEYKNLKKQEIHVIFIKVN